MPNILETFNVGSETFRHIYFTGTDTVELQDENDKTLIIYGAKGKAYTKDGKLGDFELEKSPGVWVFYENPNRDRIVCTGDLYESELMISKRWIEHCQKFAQSLVEVFGIWSDLNSEIDSEGGHCD
jgi:hypothetical protein